MSKETKGRSANLTEFCIFQSVFLALKHVHFNLLVNIMLFFFKNNSFEIIINTIMAVFINFEVGEISDFRKSTSEGTQNVCHEVIKANSINMPVLVIFQKRAYIENIVLNMPQYCKFFSSAFITLYCQTFVVGMPTMNQR